MEVGVKIVKISKRDLKDLPKLLTKVGAVFRDQAYPSAVYCSKEDAKEIRKNLLKSFKKEYPYLSNNKLKFSESMTWLNLGPNESLQDAIRPGYILVDTELMKKAVKNE